MAKRRFAPDEYLMGASRYRVASTGRHLNYDPDELTLPATEDSRRMRLYGSYLEYGALGFVSHQPLEEPGPVLSLLSMKYRERLFYVFSKNLGLDTQIYGAGKLVNGPNDSFEIEWGDASFRERFGCDAMVKNGIRVQLEEDIRRDFEEFLRLCGA